MFVLFGAVRARVCLWLLRNETRARPLRPPRSFATGSSRTVRRLAGMWEAWQVERARVRRRQRAVRSSAAISKIGSSRTPPTCCPRRQVDEHGGLVESSFTSNRTPVVRPALHSKQIVAAAGRSHAVQDAICTTTLLVRTVPSNRFFFASCLKTTKKDI